MTRPWRHPKTGTYYFRRAVPLDLRDKLGWEIKKSLGTKSAAEAKRLFVAEFQKSEQAFELARTGYELSQMQAQALAGKWLMRKLDEDAKERQAGQPLMEEGWTYDDISPYDISLSEMESAQDRRDLASVVGEDVDCLLRDEAIPLDKSSDGYARLLTEVFNAKVNYYVIQNRRYGGDWSRSKSLDKYPQFDGSLVGDRKAVSSAKSGGADDRLSGLFDAWKSDRKPAPKTMREFERGIRRFMEYHGDLRAADVDKAKVRSFKEALQRFPRVLVGKQRSMTMRQVLQETEQPGAGETLSTGSINHAYPVIEHRPVLVARPGAPTFRRRAQHRSAAAPTWRSPTRL